MKNRNIHKFAAFSVLLIGLLNLVTWTILITSGKVTDFSETPISYIFHWISEFSTAILLVLSGLLLIRKHPIQQNVLSLALGCLIMAIGEAFAYYLINLEAAMFIMSACITGLTVILIILTYEKLQDFILLTCGLTIYALINLLGDAFQAMDIQAMILEIPAFIFLLILTIGILGKNMTFRYLNKGLKK